MLCETARTPVEGAKVKGVRRRLSATRGLVLEIPGGAVVDQLAGRLSILFGDRVKMARPQKFGELRIKGLVASIAREDLVFSLATGGRCRREEVRVGEIRLTPAGIGTAWARLRPRAKLFAEGRISIGWVSLPVEALAARPMQCYRCLEFGHFRQRCTGTGMQRATPLCAVRGISRWSPYGGQSVPTPLIGERP